MKNCLKLNLVLAEEGDGVAFFRKKKTFSILIFVCILVVLLGLTFVFYYLYQTKVQEVVSEYDEKIERLNLELYALKRQVFVPKSDIPFGSILKKDMFNMVEMNIDIPQKELIDESDIGKISIISLNSGIPVLKMSVAEEELANDLREQEFNMFLVQTNQKRGDYVDVRIIFPNGENYVVLSKKQIIDLALKENIVRLWLDETEIHNISSAIIDAYIQEGTKLYVTTYIMPELQEAAIPFYAANVDVLDLMRNDPNIVEKASDFLARQVRATLEANIKAITEEDADKVTTGVNEEISKNEEIVQTFQSNDKIINSQEPSQDEADEFSSQIQDTNSEGTESFN